MGACASVPKAMRGDAGAAPAPEQPKEETTPVVAEVKAEGEVEAVETEKADDKHQSLDSLLNEGETKQDSEEVAPSTEEKAADAEATKEAEPAKEPSETKVEEAAKEEEKAQQ